MKRLFSGLVLGLTACNLVPTFQTPAALVPNTWRQADAQPAQAIEPHWWQAFGSQTLDGLMTKALADNNDLTAAWQRVEQARAQASIAGANLWPEAGINTGIDSLHNDWGQNQKRTLQFSVAYEVDLWGANRARQAAGEARWLSEAYARDALQLVVMADVGQAYFNLLAIKARAHIAQEFLQNVESVLTIVQARFDSGAISAVELAQQKTEQASAKANLELVWQQLALAENALSILLGQAPKAWAQGSEQFDDIRLPVIHPLQPASLLQRRPDIQQIELQLRAANADVGIALAGFYPKLQLNLDTLLANPQPAGLALAMAANLAQPVFQGGRLEGRLQETKARYAEWLARYQQTLLNAFKEVEDAAAIRRQADQRLQALALAVEQAQAAYRLSQEQYRVGAIDYQTLLNTQRSWLTARNNQVQARLDLLQAMVQLYKALGGGWQG